MLVRLVPLLLCLALGGAQEASAPVVRVTSGEARLSSGTETRALDARAGAVLLGAAALVESRPRSQLELTWRGSASVTFDGPAVFELAPGTGLVLQRFQTVEVEVRRGHLVLEFVGLGQLELAGGALQARALPNSLVELVNRGGTPFELRRPGAKPLAIAPGARLRLQAGATDS